MQLTENVFFNEPLGEEKVPKVVDGERIFQTLGIQLAEGNRVENKSTNRQSVRFHRHHSGIGDQGVQ